MRHSADRAVNDELCGEAAARLAADGEIMEREFDSEWYLAVNEDNRFTTVQGVARTTIGPDALAADLYLRADSTLYAKVRATVGDKAKVIGELMRQEAGAEPVPVRGYHFQKDEDVLGETLREDEDVSIVLTDGWTTLGIAKAAER